MTCTTSSINPVLAGGIVALLAFGLSVARESWRTRAERDARQIGALRGFVEELQANREAASNTLTLLAVEARDQDAGKVGALVNPLSSLESGAWPTARVDLPQAVIVDSALVRRLHLIHRNTADINGLIQSRETFRIQHLRDEALLISGLRAYKGPLSHLLEDLQLRIDADVDCLREVLVGHDKRRRVGSKRRRTSAS